MQKHSNGQNRKQVAKTFLILRLIRQVRLEGFKWETRFFFSVVKSVRQFPHFGLKMELKVRKM